ncbi:unnamed protein product [Alternaria alternata]
MSTERGDFYYPLEEDHLNINYNDQVDVYWWSTFAELLLINCSESIAGGKGYNFKRNINENGTERWGPIQLSQEFDDWSKPVGCQLAIFASGIGSITGATIGVTSDPTHSASIMAMSSTAAKDPVMTPSTTPAPSVTPSSAAPTTTPTDPKVTGSTGDGGSLSTGAKAGIGVGVGVGAILVAAAAYLFYRNHRKMKDLNARLSYQSESQQYSKPAGVAVAHHAGNEYNSPYSEATAWSQGHHSPQAPPRELGGSQ